MQVWLANEDDTRAAGAALAPILVSMTTSAPVVVFIRGNLGAGKSTLVRGLLTELGVKGVMPSPTYTLVEPYQVGSLKVYHMDAYRLADGAELDYLGLDDINAAGSVLLVEWPDHVSGALPAPSLTLDLELAPNPDQSGLKKRRENIDMANADLEAESKDIQTGTSAGGDGLADPGRLLGITMDTLPDLERERLLSAECWSKLIRVVT
jgi:tRNA threonylcarbamoyladenosine biosynthesis protein TsaE